MAGSRIGGAVRRRGVRPTQQAMRVKRIICQYVRSFRICTAFAGSCQLLIAHCHHHWADENWIEWSGDSVSWLLGPAFGPSPCTPSPVLEFFVRLCRLFNCSLSQRNPATPPTLPLFPFSNDHNLPPFQLAACTIRLAMVNRA